MNRQVTPRRIDVLNLSAIVDERPMGAFQRRLLWLVGLAIVMDGFDVQAMGFVAPAIVQDWGVARAALGPVFGAGLVGMLLGSLVMSTAADRIGRRPLLIAATVFFSLTMLATAAVTTMQQLLALRLVTGFGLGGVMANAVALAGEYSPTRRRATLMMWVSCGFTGGGLIGGLASAALVPTLGWRAVFVLGGLVPLATAAAMLRWLPESIELLAARGHGAARIAPWLSKLAPDLAIDERTRIPVATSEGGSSVTALFAGGRAATTLLLWCVNFLNLLNLFFLANWLPTIAADAGFGPRWGVAAGALLQGGGVIGTLALGPAIDRRGYFKVLVPVFMAAVPAIATIGHPGLPALVLALAVLVAGVCIVGAQPALNALAASLYPTDVRATGMGWSLGIGRAGSIVGPLVAGWLLSLHWTPDTLFAAAAVPAALSSLLLMVLGWRRPDAAARVEAPLAH